MTTMYDDSNIRTIADLQAFLNAAEVFEITTFCPRKERAQWICERLVRFRYLILGKRERGIVLTYLRRVTSLTEKQIDRHVRAYKAGKKLHLPYRRRIFSVRYAQEDRELLAETDNCHGRLSGQATRNICAHQHAAGDQRYTRLAHISKTHLYRFRQSSRYRVRAMTFERTQAVNRAIGERRKPEPNGAPGFLRVDTVHQGDFGKEKGVYHLNLIDVTTQWEVILSVEQISEKFLKPVLKEALSFFPFTIKGFHTDNGSEFINDCVSRVLRGMKIEQTKSRPRKSNDNALVESKNGAIIRKWLGHWHVPGKYAARLNVFHREHLVPYINFHRPCAFPEVTVLPDGKRKVRYWQEDYATPCEKLLSLPNVEQYLQSGVTRAWLEEQARKKTPNDAAREMQEAKRKLFSLILPRSSPTLSPSS